MGLFLILLQRLVSEWRRKGLERSLRGYYNNEEQHLIQLLVYFSPHLLSFKYIIPHYHNLKNKLLYHSTGKKNMGLTSNMENVVAVITSWALHLDDTEFLIL